MPKNSYKSVTLNYHNISPGCQIGINRVHPSLFFSHVQMLSSLDNMDISITFDDGYEDIYKYAMPILKKERKIKSPSVFIITDYINKFNTWDYSFYFNRYKHLNESQIRDLSDLGWDVGSHGASHRAFFSMSDSDLKKELIESKNILEEITEKEVLSISPPFGRIDDRVCDACRSAGYKNIYINGISTVNLSEDINVIERNNVYSLNGLDSVYKKINNPRVEMNKERWISSLNNLTIFFKKVLR